MLRQFRDLAGADCALSLGGDIFPLSDSESRFDELKKDRECFVRPPDFVDMKSLLHKLVRTPICIFQAGKVGSSSLRGTLSENTDRAVVQAHNWDMLTPKQKVMLRFRRALALPIDVISPIRDPVSRNVSAFFENFERDTGQKVSDRSWTVEEIADLFVSSFASHHEGIIWFDQYFKPVFGIDVYAEPFPVAEMRKVYRRGRIRALVYRVDLERADQLALVGDFAGLELPDWAYRNISATKDYADIYRRFTESGRLPREYVARMCESRFCRHFWTSEEIDAIRARWSE